MTPNELIKQLRALPKRLREESCVWVRVSEHAVSRVDKVVPKQIVFDDENYPIERTEIYLE